MTDTEIDDMRRETRRLQAEAELLMARKHLEDAKRDDRKVVFYLFLAGLSLPLLVFLITRLL